MTAAKNIGTTQAPGGMPRSAQRGLAGQTGGFDRSTVMMGVLFLVGIGWVLWESHAAGKAGPTDREGSNAVMVQAGLADMNRVVARDSAGQGGVVANFYHKASERQVPLAALPVNPFITFGWEPPPGKDQLVEAKENSAPAAPSAPPVKQLQLQSVLVMGNNSSATISGEFVTQGQVVAGWQVERIAPAKVVLRWQDKTHVLNMPQ